MADHPFPAKAKPRGATDQPADKTLPSAAPLMRAFLRLFRYVRRLERQNTRLMEETMDWRRFFPPGHFYSPVPSMAEVDDAYARNESGPPFAGIDLRENEQLALFEKLAAHYRTLALPEHATEGWRYHLDNGAYGIFDGVLLACMLCHLQPRRVIEIGSGCSSAAMLDINERVLGGRMHLTIIDPVTVRVRGMLRPEDLARVRLIESRVQDVPLDTFAALEAGDVLFIDSSHVSKIGSDVHRLYFDVLPVLRPGVFVHIHDIAATLEYPREWFAEGRAWNEAYLVRAFLMFNRAFEVALFTSWLRSAHPELVRTRMPLCAQGGGGQLWLRRTA
jgi:hypothetical protein